MTDLADFILQRIAEDEAAARQVPTDILQDGLERGAVSINQFRAVRHFSPDRLLARCKADRRIVEEHGDGGSYCGVCAVGLWHLERESMPCSTLKLLALPYAGHPDYRQEWRP